MLWRQGEGVIEANFHARFWRIMGYRCEITEGKFFMRDLVYYVRNNLGIYQGDRYLKPWIIPVPEVTIIPRSKEDECLILASDGLWDVMTNEEVCDAARKRILLWHKKNGVPLAAAHRGEEADPAAQAAADYLSKLALQKGSKDNITVVVIDLKAQRKFKRKT